MNVKKVRFLNFAIWPSANYWLNNSYLWKFIILHLDLISMSHLYAQWNCYHKIIYNTTTSINLLHTNLNLHHPLLHLKTSAIIKRQVLLSSCLILNYWIDERHFRTLTPVIYIFLIILSITLCRILSFMMKQ